MLRPDDTVLVANEERKLEIRPVEVVRAEPRKVYISDGVRGGELIVTTSMDAPIPGTQLAVSGEDPPEPNDETAAESELADAETGQ